MRLFVLLVLSSAIVLGGCTSSGNSGGGMIMTPYMDRPVQALSEDEYMAEIRALSSGLESGYRHLDGAQDAQDVDDAAAEFGVACERFAVVAPPPEYAALHEELMGSVSKCGNGCDMFRSAIRSGDRPAQEAGLTMMLEGYQEIREFGN